MPERILIVDDETALVDLVSYNLQKEGFETFYAYDGMEAIRLIRQENPDLVILDIMLPKIDGLEVCQRVREFSDVPVIMLTARKTESDKIIGFDYGADDYLTKPFSPRELVARVKALLRRSTPKEKSATLKAGYLLLDTEGHLASVSGKAIDLTAKEFELLKLLMMHPGRVFTRDQLFEKIWDAENYYDTRTIDVHIRHIREKIEENPSAPVYILTVRGIGYKFNDKYSK